MSEHGFNVIVIPRTQATEIAINQTRNIFKRFIFDENRCAQGLKCLDNYVYKVNEKYDVYGTPLHNWASNGADSLRQIGQYYADKHVANKHDEDKWGDVQDQMNYEVYESYDNEWNDYSDWD